MGPFWVDSGQGEIFSSLYFPDTTRRRVLLIR
jgi:hypothetical protein